MRGHHQSRNNRDLYIISYEDDERWKANGFEIQGTLFRNDSRKFCDDVPKGYDSFKSWKGKPDEPSPKDFLPEMRNIAFNEELTARGLGKLIMANMDQSMRRLVQEHIQKSLNMEESDARILHIWDFLWNLHGNENMITESVIEKLKQKNMTAESYYEL